MSTCGHIGYIDFECSDCSRALGARAEERAAIVAFLRGIRVHGSVSAAYYENQFSAVAKSIERGDHLDPLSHPELGGPTSQEKPAPSTELANAVQWAKDEQRRADICDAAAKSAIARANEAEAREGTAKFALALTEKRAQRLEAALREIADMATCENEPCSKFCTYSIARRALDGSIRMIGSGDK